MFEQQIRKIGAAHVVEIPAQEMVRLGLAEGDTVRVVIRAINGEPLELGVNQAFEESWERNEAGYRYLADR